MAGVRYSIDNPDLYVNVNIGGFINLVEQAVKNNVLNFEEDRQKTEPSYL